MLNLAELMEKNLDKQPQLLAMLQPNLRSSLLHNPALLDTIEKLERSDPIGKKAKDVRKFIQSIKSETFGDFEPVALHKLDGDKLIRFNRNLSTSLTVERTAELQRNDAKQHKRANSNEETQDDDTIIIQVNSTNNEQSKQLLENLSLNNNLTLKDQAPNSQLDMKLEHFKELKDTVSGLDANRLRGSTKQAGHLNSQSAIAGKHYQGMAQRNATSSKIVGLNQLGKFKKTALENEAPNKVNLNI